MKVMPTIGFTLFISLFFVVGFGILGYGIRSLVLSNKAKTWPTTKGHIETCMVTESSDSEGDQHRDACGTLYGCRQAAYG